MTEKEIYLIRDFQSGNKDAFISLYDAYVKKVYNFIYYKTSHKETAEDLTSQCFLKALKALPDFKNNKDSSFAAWLFSIARNSVTDYYRSKKDVKDIDDIWDLAGNDDIERDFEFKEKSRQIESYLKGLKSEQREIIIMRVFQEMSYKEIAEIIGKSEESCKVAFSRALKKMKSEMPLAVIVSLFLFNLN